MTRAMRDGATTRRDVSEGRLSAMFASDYDPNVNTLDILRDRVLRMATVPMRARWAAGQLRAIAFSRWCSACQHDDHFNHADRRVNVVDSLTPPHGGCWSVNLGKWLCTCPKKEASQ